MVPGVARRRIVLGIRARRGIVPTADMLPQTLVERLRSALGPGGPLQRCRTLAGDFFEWFILTSSQVVPFLRTVTAPEGTAA